MYKVIVNPGSQSGIGRNIWYEIKPILEDRGLLYDVRYTEQAQNACAVASELTETVADDDVLMILGGDGTLNEALNGLTDPEKIPIAYIPTGSSNDFARDMPISYNPAIALKHVLKKTNLMQSDVGEVRYYDAYDRNGIPIDAWALTRRFLISCGIGFDAAVCEKALHSKFKDTLNKLRIGSLTYGGIAVREFVHAPQIMGKIYVDDQIPIEIPKFLFAAGMVHRFEGGGFCFCPDADATDGVLDYCAGGGISKLRFAKLLPKAAVGRHVGADGVYVDRAHTLRIKTQVPLWVHTDGEVEAMSTQIEMRCDRYKARFFTGED